MREWTVVRAGLWLLALSQGSTAAWALAAPRSFYDDFPGGGAAWVSSMPPYNEHLVRDYASAFLALSVLAAVAAVVAEARLVRVTLLVLLIAALPHLIFHAAHADEGGAGPVVSLALNAAVPLVLLFLVPKKETATP